MWRNQYFKDESKKIEKQSSLEIKKEHERRYQKFTPPAFAPRNTEPSYDDISISHNHDTEQMIFHVESSKSLANSGRKTKHLTKKGEEADLVEAHS